MRGMMGPSEGEVWTNNARAQLARLPPSSAIEC